MAWAFTYDHETGNTRGIDAHSDMGKVSINLWVTPDEANLEPETGGLLLYERYPPETWDFASYNHNTTRIQEYLGPEPSFTRVVHRENRCLLFWGRRFHQTDRMRFRKGFKNRRINITWLYG